MTKPNAIAPQGVHQRIPQTRYAIVPIGDRLTVKGRLALLGWPTFTAWAEAHGYDRQMPGYVVRIWGNRTDREPHGGLARALMRDLRRTLDEGLRPQPQTAASVDDAQLPARLTTIIGRETVASFALRAGVDESNLRAYMKRGVKPGLDHLIAICRAGNVSLDWLALGDH